MSTRHGPRESRADSYARAARAASMRGTGATWEQIARHEGYPNRTAACKAAQRHHSREHGSIENQRHDADESYRIVQQMMFTELAEAKRDGDRQGLVAVAGRITEVIGKRVVLNGLAAPQRSEVAVGVEVSLDKSIEDTERLLLTLAGQRQAQLPAQPFIDAEAVEVP